MELIALACVLLPLSSKDQICAYDESAAILTANIANMANFWVCAICSAELYHLHQLPFAATAACKLYALGLLLEGWKVIYRRPCLNLRLL